MDWITDRIAIGNYVEAQDATVLRPFTSVLSLIPTLKHVREGNKLAIELLSEILELPDQESFDKHLNALLGELERKRLAIIELIDGPGNDVRLFHEAVATLEELVRESPPVFVHCHAGKGRSPLVVAGYLMKTRGFTATKALDFIGAKRDIYVQDALAALLESLE